ncbi:deaminase [Nocardia camponoti]|uniref:CMP/dCMP-type deaminase domain-containing protein n=1 Tax=Nocardia camponoti TaxID=1616106 RepID=A0A917QKD6_9NOCA|nr:deaminase [Nocardia camponoti]GGK54770.1 hypothetical protein GCM10011591_28250 [Nocardia camponoti]
MGTNSPTNSTDEAFMHRAIDLARQCPPSETAYSVGAVIVVDGEEIATGFSREGNDEKLHAEEAALNKLDPADPRLTRATIYSTLEPCSTRASKDHQPCAERILAAGIPNVVIAWREPSLFVAACAGVDNLREAGVDVRELPDLAEQAMAPNRHLNLN